MITLTEITHILPLIAQSNPKELNVGLAATMRD
jgi:hypothetical protein